MSLFLFHECGNFTGFGLVWISCVFMHSLDILSVGPTLHCIFLNKCFDMCSRKIVNCFLPEVLLVIMLVHLFRNLQI